ncbi:hypothetical protein M758_UG128200 [Ceratodon purpureus]|nr:hypothetical protein M758_UG128200 [Ceratodon purpureus]
MFVIDQYGVHLIVNANHLHNGVPATSRIYFHVESRIAQLPVGEVGIIYIAQRGCNVAFGGLELMRKLDQTKPGRDAKSRRGVRIKVCHPFLVDTYPPWGGVGSERENLLRNLDIRCAEEDESSPHVHLERNCFLSQFVIDRTAPR